MKYVHRRLRRGFGVFATEKVLKRESTIGFVGLVAVVLTGIGWVIMPSMESASRSVDAEVSIHFERARRLLHRYELGLTYKSIMLDRFAEAGVDVDADDMDELVESVGDEFQEHHASQWEQFRPTDWTADPPRPRKANYGNLPRQISDGLADRSRLLAINDRLLDDAMVSVDAGLAVSVGDVSGRNHPEAIRLKGVILYYQGITEHLRAMSKRAEAGPYRDQMAKAALAALRKQGATEIADASGISESIADLRAARTQARADERKQRERLAQLKTTIAELEARHQEATAARDNARRRMEEIMAAGVNFADPNGSQAFSDSLLSQDEAFRAAGRAVQAIEAGSFPNAVLESPDDLLHSRLLENGRATDLTLEHGLRHYRQVRDVVVGSLIHFDQAGQDSDADIARLEAMLASLKQEEQSAKRTISSLMARANEAYTQFNRLESEAYALEDDALNLLERAAKTGSQSATQVVSWVRDAQNRTSKMSSEASSRSAFGQRQKDGWMGGFISAQIAQARMAKAWIHHDRYQWYSQNTDGLVKFAGVLQLREVDAESEQTKVDEALEAGVAEIEKAMVVLKKAHGLADRHWTIVAQSAGAMQLMALFGHEGYLGDAIEAYRSALKGRETKPGSEVFAAHLSRLENR